MCPWRQPGSGRNGPRAAPRTGTGEHVLAALCRSSPMRAFDLARQVAIAAARDARTTYRNGLVAPTAGIAPGMTQANLIALPRAWAYDFLLYAQRNPKACPILDVRDAGSPRIGRAPWRERGGQDG